MWMILAASGGFGKANNLLRVMTVELSPEEPGMAREKAKNSIPVP